MLRKVTGLCLKNQPALRNESKLRTPVQVHLAPSGHRCRRGSRLESEINTESSQLPEDRRADRGSISDGFRTLYSLFMTLLFLVKIHQGDVIQVRSAHLQQDAVQKS